LSKTSVCNTFPGIGERSTATEPTLQRFSFFRRDDALFSDFSSSNVTPTPEEVARLLSSLFSLYPSLLSSKLLTAILAEQHDFSEIIFKSSFINWFLVNNFFMQPYKNAKVQIGIDCNWLFRTRGIHFCWSELNDRMRSRIVQELLNGCSSTTIPRRLVESVVTLSLIVGNRANLKELLSDVS
jgi:hypothetical protein